MTAAAEKAVALCQRNAARGRRVNVHGWDIRRCRTRGCGCAHGRQMLVARPYELQCDRGLIPAPAGARSADGRPYSADALVRCPTCAAAYTAAQERAAVTR